MAKKQFKTESKKLLDMMINSIYTHKEIFLRELISNASDAMDKLYFRSLTDPSVTVKQEEYEIRLTVDRESRTLSVSDNGCGMTPEELEKNLGTIAKSDSYDFKANAEAGEQPVDIIGQFGVGFYSAFMVSDSVTVESKAYGSDTAACFASSGVDGYTVAPCEKEQAGTTVTLHLKPDSDEESYGEFLQEYRLRELVKKYSDYIRYPIRMQVTRTLPPKEGEETGETVTEDETLNSMVPLWKKDKSQVSEEEYNTFYREKFYDYQPPLSVVRQKAEGTSNYEALLFIPSHAPFDYYSREFEKGLQLYSGGVLIMENCKDLLPDHFGFVRGLVDSSDLSLNISREMLQHDRQLKIIAKALEKKIAGELARLRDNDREKYESFFAAFGAGLKYGLYSEFGAHKDLLQDLILFPSTFGEHPVTFAEYLNRMKDGQEKIYYASGESKEQISLLPKVEAAVARGYEVLLLCEDVDEFALQMLRTYGEKEFVDLCKEATDDFYSQEERDALKAENEAQSELLGFLKDSLGESVHAVRFTNALQGHPVCLTSEGALSVSMEKVLNKMPGADGHMKAEVVLEINREHPVAQKLIELYPENKEKLADYAKILYANARLISGLTPENPSELADLICGLM